MSATFNDYSRKQTTPPKNLLVVAALHVLLAWGLLVGTTVSPLAMIKKPLSMQLIEDVALVPPAPTPQKIKTPPPTIPLPEVIAERHSSTIEMAIASQVPQTQEIIVPTPISTAKVVEPSVPPKMEVALICPGQVPPDIPRKALIEGIQGTVRAQAFVQEGHVKEVNIISGPRIFHDAVRTAMLQYKCAVQHSAVVAMQEFNFRYE
jgi:protein TonB